MGYTISQKKYVCYVLLRIVYTFLEMWISFFEHRHYFQQSIARSDDISSSIKRFKLRIVY